MAQPAEKHEQLYTYADLLQWPEEERWELIEGVPVDMSPAPGRTHQDIVANIFVQLHASTREFGCTAYFAPIDVRLPETATARDEEIATVVQPDILVVCDEEKLDERGCRGAPDLVVEVVSPTSVLRDNIEKLRLYERHGVREYWIVHPVDRLLFQRVLEDTATGRRYGVPSVFGPGGKVACHVLPEVTVDLGLVFPADPPRQASPSPKAQTEDNRP